MIVQALAVGLAFAAGLVSFVSPCVLPLVPAYAAYLSGRSGLADRPRTDTIPAGAAFVAGLSVVFILLFYLLRQALQPVRPYAVPVAGVALLLLAANVAGLVRLPLPQRELRLMRAEPGMRGPLGGFPLGLGFATGWTPRIGLTLGAVLSAGAVSGATLTGFPANRRLLRRPGCALPGIALLLERALPALRPLSRRRRVIDWSAAEVPAAMGVLPMTNNLTWITQQLTRLLPRGLLSPLGL